MKTSNIRDESRKLRTYSQEEIDSLDPIRWGNSPLFRDDGIRLKSDGTNFIEVISGGGDGLTIISSVSAMSLLDTNTLNTDDIVYVSGYHAGLYYGGGLFRLNKTSTTTVDNGIIFAATNGRWIRSGDISTVDITWFGAKINDDTFDSRPAFNNACYYLPITSLNRNVTAPMGKFYFHSKRNITDNSGLAIGKWAGYIYGKTKFTGAGKYLTEIIMHNTSPVDTPCIRFEEGADEFELSGFTIDGNRQGRGIPPESQDEDEGIDGKINNKIFIINILIKNTGQDGIDIDGGVGQYYDNITIEDCNGFAMHLTEDETLTFPSLNIVIKNSQFRRNGMGRSTWFSQVYAINVQGGDTLIDTCEFEENYAGVIFQRQQYNNNRIINCKFTNLTEISGDNLIATETPNTKLVNNTIVSNINKGVINIQDTAVGSLVSGNNITVTHTTIAGSASYALRIADKSKAIDNEITCSYVGIFLGGDGAKAIDNTIDQTNLTNSAAYPIICNQPNCVASINTILSSAGPNITRGIYGSGSTNFSVTNNVISDQRGSVRFSGTASGGQISGNVMDNVAGHDTVDLQIGSTGIFVTGNTAELTITDSGTNIVSNNLIAGALVA